DDVRDDRYFTLDELRRYRLSDRYQIEGLAVADIAYHALPDRITPQKRLVEHVRNLFFNAADPNLATPLRLGELDYLALPFESCRRALTAALLDAVYPPGHLSPAILSDLRNSEISGYLSGDDLAIRFGEVPTGDYPEYWARSGTAGFEPDATRHFYLPERYT